MKIKPWGTEQILEQNEFYVLKRLVMKKGHSCSLQYHEKKKETIYVLSGILEIEINGNKKVYKVNSFVTIFPNEIHRMKAISTSKYLEASTNYLEDVVRLEDDYGRV